MPSGFTVTGSPVTTSGTLTAAWSSQAQNSVLAGPATGGAGTPLWRALVRADLPTDVVTGAGTVNSVPLFNSLHGLATSPINVLNAQQVGINIPAVSTAALTVSGYTNTAFNHAFRATDVNSSILLAIENTGRVGLRTDAPTRNLDVNGEARIRDLNTTSATVLVGSDADGVLSSLSIANAPFTINTGNVVSRVNQSVTTLGPAGSSLQVGIAGFTGGVYRINMSSVTSTLTLTTTGQVDGGVYTFHFINTGSKSVDFPNTFFTQTGALLDGGSTYPLPNDLFITCYSDGLNFYCK
jgi:hypothetical protein